MEEAVMEEAVMEEAVMEEAVMMATVPEAAVMESDAEIVPGELPTFHSRTAHAHVRTELNNLAHALDLLPASASDEVAGVVQTYRGSCRRKGLALSWACWLTPTCSLTTPQRGLPANVGQRYRTYGLQVHNVDVIVVCRSR
ncbi:hypothetical protein Vafri_1543 [Volvox africanus]|nr:hypothetical protein Vafri_1543 [Volvox africanus]